MEFNKKTKLLLVAISAFLVMIISTVSYAYFSATVAGNTTAKTSVIETGNMEVTYNEGAVIGTTTKILPGQYVQKSFTVENTGTVDTTYSIYLNNVENNFVTKSDLVYESITTDGRVVNQTICPNSNTVIATGVSLPVGTTHHYTIRITFKETNLNQDDNKGKSFTAKIGLEEEKTYTIVNGNLDTVGSIVKIADEEFYVIGQEDANHVKLLSKWNLNIGRSAKGTPTNLQDEEVRGYSPNYETSYGTLEYSYSQYWHQNGLNPEYGTSYPAYVYTNKKENGEYIASIAEYVDNYVDYLKLQGVNVEGRLIKQEELVNLGCNASSKYCDAANNGIAPEWVYQTSFWTGTATDYRSVWRVNANGYFDTLISWIDTSVGVRPVIILEK